MWCVVVVLVFFMCGVFDMGWCKMSENGTFKTKIKLEMVS